MVSAHALCLLSLCMAGVEAAGGAVDEDCREYRRRAALPPWLLLAVQLYAHILLVGLCDEGT